MAGEELLIVDETDRDREGLRRFFDHKAFVCTTARTGAEARELVVQKFFPAALVDLDVDGPSGGLELVRFIRERSAQTATILITTRRSFEAAVSAHRMGVEDIIVKAPDQVEQMREAVSKATMRYRLEDRGGDLFRDLRGVLNDSFKVMLELSRKVYADLSMAASPIMPTVLFVDGDGQFLNVLAPLVQPLGWNILAEMTGGAALDRASQERVDIMVVRTDLPDLKGSMVIKSIQAEKPEVLGLLYTPPGPGGRIDRVDRGQAEPLLPAYSDVAVLVDAAKKLGLELATKAQERRLIQAFSQDHREFLRRFAKVKSQVDTLEDT